MALTYMLDTDTCVFALNGRLGLDERLSRSAGQVCMSSITFGELSYGAENSNWRDANLGLLHAFRNLVPALSFDEQAASHFGSIKIDLRRAGTPCGPYDMLIGAHARSLGLTLVTNNRREFDRMPGLKVENWAG